MPVNSRSETSFCRESICCSIFSDLASAFMLARISHETPSIVSEAMSVASEMVSACIFLAPASTTEARTTPTMDQSSIPDG